MKSKEYSAPLTESLEEELEYALLTGSGENWQEGED